MITTERARADHQFAEERQRHEAEIERLVGQVHAERFQTKGGYLIA